jgi:hypothetical protein
MKKNCTILILILASMVLSLQAQKRPVDYVHLPGDRPADQSGGHRIQATVAGMGWTCLSRCIRTQRNGAAEPDHQIRQRRRIRV